MTDPILSPIIGIYETKYFTLRKTATSGYGLFAKQAIKGGTTILQETPLIPNIFERVSDVKSKIDPLRLYGLFNALSRQDKLTYLSMARSDSMANKHMDALDTGRRDVLPCLFVLAATFETNGFGGGVYKLASRLNHSCQPNLKYNNDMQNGDAIKICALRDIAKGEELTICYVKDYFYEDRFNRLLRFDFTCRCDACIPSNRAISETRRRRIWRLATEFLFMAERLLVAMSRLAGDPTSDADDVDADFEPTLTYGPVPPSLIVNQRFFNPLPAFQEAERLLVEESGIQDLGETTQSSAWLLADLIVKCYSVWDLDPAAAASVQPYPLPSSLSRKSFTVRAGVSASRFHSD